MLPYWNFANNAFVLAVWTDAADIDPTVLDSLLRTANSVCVAYAPTLSVDAVIPDSYKMAEIFQARDIWSKFGGGNSEQYGPDGMSIPVYPLVFVARDLLRPASSPLKRLR